MVRFSGCADFTQGRAAAEALTALEDLPVDATASKLDQEQPAAALEEDRRLAEERRASGGDRRSGLERRRGPGRRRSDSRRSAEEGELNAEQFEFVMAMDEYKRANKKPFPSWTEVLEVVKYLGYRKVAEVGEHVDRPAADSD